MKLPIYTVTLAIAAAVAFAQDTPPAQQQQPTQTGAGTPAGSQTQTPTGSGTQTPTTSGSQTTTKNGGSDRMNEMKTRSYSGTLMDASCGGAGSSASMTSSSSS